MKEDLTNNLLRTVIVFLCYFLYSNVFLTVLTNIGISNSVLISFISDFVFLIGIIFVYRNELNDSISKLKKDFKFKNILKKVLCWVAIIFVFNIIMGIITDVIWPDYTMDNNTKALSNIGSNLYIVFKTMIFAVIAEELVYRISIRKIIFNKKIFILVSAIIYTLMNCLFVGFDDGYLLLSIIIYFLPALIFSYAYVKNNDNIIIFMLIKFTYNLIPTIIFLLSL